MKKDFSLGSIGTAVASVWNAINWPDLLNAALSTIVCTMLAIAIGRWMNKGKSHGKEAVQKNH
ncbi:MAG: hypothetical protein AAFR61_15065 [Bacteroidota bacterium]